MLVIRDLVWLIIIFLIVLIIFMLFRPIFIMKRDPLTGRPIEIVDGWKLIGSTLLLTFLIALVVFLAQRCNWNHTHKGDLVL